MKKIFDQKKYGKKVWTNKVLQMNEWQSRLLLLDKSTGECIAELTSGKWGLEKYHKNSYEIYVKTILTERIISRDKQMTRYLEKAHEQELLSIYFKRLREKTNAKNKSI